MPRLTYTLEQRRFDYDTYMRKKSIKKYRQGNSRAQIAVKHKSMIQQLVKKVCETGRTVLTEEKLEAIDLLENSPNKSLSKLAQQARVSVSSVYKATKFLNFKPYKFAFSAPVMVSNL
ncbi:hypothetical protein C0J52_14316 [Blattella germanica]|nr:hypothetical protein C0J52_14316 [Blattella germanica]